MASKKQDLAKMIIILAVIISIGTMAGSLKYLAELSRPQPITVQPSPNPTSNPTSEKNLDSEKDETADWKIYKNEEYNFEFKYPANWDASSGELNWLGEGGASYDPYKLIAIKPSEIQGDSLVNMVCKSQVSYEEMVNFFSGPNHNIKVLEDVKFGKRNGKLISDYNIYVKTESRFIIIETSEKGKCTLFQPTVENSEYPFSSKYNPIIEKILSSFKFI